MRKLLLTFKSSIPILLCLLALVTITAPSRAVGFGRGRSNVQVNVGSGFRGGFPSGFRGGFFPGGRTINGNFFRANYGYYGGRYYGTGYGYGASFYPAYAGYSYPSYAGYSYSGYSYNPNVYYSQALLSYLIGTAPAPAYSYPAQTSYLPSYTAQPNILTILVGTVPGGRANPADLAAPGDPGYTVPAPRAMPYADPGSTAAIGSVQLPALSAATITYLQPLTVTEQLAFLDRVYGRGVGLRLFQHHFGPRGISRVRSRETLRQTGIVTDPSKRTTTATRTTIVPAPGVRESVSTRAVERTAKTAAGHHRK